MRFFLYCPRISKMEDTDIYCTADDSYHVNIQIKMGLFLMLVENTLNVLVVIFSCYRSELIFSIPVYEQLPQERIQSYFDIICQKRSS